MSFDPLQKVAPLWARALAAFLLLTWLAWSDWKKNGTNATRYEECLFLMCSTCVAVAFAEIHDFVTVSISPEYFIEGKGLAAADLNWSVAKLAVAASYWVGLVCGMIYLICNNPLRDRPQLSYRTLYALMALPIIGAMISAPIFGFWYRNTVTDFDPAFSLVWGIHTGSYVGGALGAILGMCLILLKRVRNRVVREE